MCDAYVIARRSASSSGIPSARSWAADSWWSMWCWTPSRRGRPPAALRWPMCRYFSRTKKKITLCSPQMCTNNLGWIISGNGLASAGWQAHPSSTVAVHPAVHASETCMMQRCRAGSARVRLWAKRPHAVRAHAPGPPAARGRHRARLRPGQRQCGGQRPGKGAGARPGPARRHPGAGASRLAMCGIPAARMHICCSFVLLSKQIVLDGLWTSFVKAQSC